MDDPLDPHPILSLATLALLLALVLVGYMTATDEANTASEYAPGGGL